MNDNYSELAVLYDELQKGIDYLVFTDLIDKHTKKSTSVLEIGCGTGVVSKYLYDNNYQVDSFDLSCEMINICKSKYDNINFYVDNIITFKTEKEYDYVLCLMDTLNYVIDINDLKQSFKNVYDSLKKAGIFIFDVHQIDNDQLFDNYSEEKIINNKTFKWNSQVYDKLMVHNFIINDKEEMHKQYLYSEIELHKCFDKWFELVEKVSDDYKDYYILKKK